MEGVLQLLRVKQMKKGRFIWYKILALRYASKALQLELCVIAMGKARKSRF